MSLSEQYPDFYWAWVAEGGIEDALRWALLAAKALPATNRDMLDFIRAMQATGNGIMENIIGTAD